MPLYAVVLSLRCSNKNALFIYVLRPLSSVSRLPRLKDLNNTWWRENFDVACYMVFFILLLFPLIGPIVLSSLFSDTCEIWLSQGKRQIAHLNKTCMYVCMFVCMYNTKTLVMYVLIFGILEDGVSSFELNCGKHSFYSFMWV